MKQFFATVLVFLSLSQTAFCEEAVLDVFEEYAQEEAEYVTYPCFLETEVNASADGMLSFYGNGGSIEIVNAPKKGRVTLTGPEGTFCYTPFPEVSGADSFTFRLGDREEYSNISTCSIEIAKPEEALALGFRYTDMASHWANASAVRLVEQDVMKGERIGNQYFFRPDTQMRRIDVVSYLLSVLKVDYESVSARKARIFADSNTLPDYINRMGYMAKQIGLIEGSEDAGQIALKPYEPICRAEMIKMLDHAMRTPSSSQELTYTDARSVPGWALQSVKNLSSCGMVKGFSDGSLRPQELITKAEVASLIDRMMRMEQTTTVQTLSQQMKQGFYGTVLS